MDRTSGGESCNTFVLIFNKNTGCPRVPYFLIDPGKRHRLIPKMFTLSFPRIKDIIGFRAIVNDGMLYIIGGKDWDTGAFIGHILRFDPKTNVWTKRSPLNTPRTRHTVVGIEGCIYAVGGEGKGGRLLHSAEVYNPVHDMWAEVCPLPRPRADHACCALNGKLYISGGCSELNLQLSDVFWLYDPKRDNWTEAGSRRFSIAAEMTSLKTSLPEVKEKHNMVQCGNKIYCLGGITVKRKGKRTKPKVDESILSFNPDNPGWFEEPLPTLNPRCNAGVFALGHNIFVVGGQKLHGTDVPMVEYYNTVKKTWNELWNLTETGCQNVDCCVVDIPVSNKEFSKLGLALHEKWIMW